MFPYLETRQCHQETTRLNCACLWSRKIFIGSMDTRSTGWRKNKQHFLKFKKNSPFYQIWFSTITRFPEKWNIGTTVESVWGPDSFNKLQLSNNANSSSSSDSQTSSSSGSQTSTSSDSQSSSSSSSSTSTTTSYSSTYTTTFSTTSSSTASSSGKSQGWMNDFNKAISKWQVSLEKNKCSLKRRNAKY